MFRNAYLDTYKHAVLYNKEVQFMFVHLSQIYTTLGSVINDIEYQFGLLLSQIKTHDKNSRTSGKSMYGIAIPPHQSQNYQINEIEDIQNKIQNFGNGQRKKIPQIKLDQSNFILPMKSQNKTKVEMPKNQKRNSRQLQFFQQKRQQENESINMKNTNNLIDNTQDFDALFLPRVGQINNQNSKSVSRRSNKEPTVQSQNINKNQTNSNVSNANKKSTGQNYMDRLFGN